MFYFAWPLTVGVFFFFFQRARPDVVHVAGSDRNFDLRVPMRGLLLTLRSTLRQVSRQPVGRSSIGGSLFSKVTEAADSALIILYFLGSSKSEKKSLIN